jgi:bla regulator protein blaR1
MIFSGFQILAQMGVERVLNSLPAGLLIALFVWLLLRITGKHGSGTRFAVWFLTLLAIAALPFVPSLPAARTLTAGIHPQVTLPSAWALAVLAAWALIAILATIRVTVGLWKLRRIRNNAIPIPASDLPLVLREVLEQLGTTRTVAVCASADVSVPTALGFFKPLVLIPKWALRDLSPEEFRVVLLHELAHLRRWDDWTNLAQKLIRTVFFFHPAVWWIEKQLSLEREMACDDVVLAATENPRAYAECLVALAERSFVRRGLALAQAVLGRVKDTSLRLAYILDGKRNGSTRLSKRAVGIALAFVALCLSIVPSAPVLVGFENPEPAAVAASADRVSSLPQASVVPAALHVANPSPGAYEKRLPAQVAHHRSPRLSQVFAAKQKQVHAQPAQVERAAMQQSTPVAQFLVLMQSSEDDGRGSAIVRFAVWRVTFVSAEPNKVQSTVTSKSI